VLNDILSGAFASYVEAIQTGEKLELEGDYKGWVMKALEQSGIRDKALPS
jgi:hypothetical protein